MTDFLLEKAKQYKDQGHDHGKIRLYLRNSGHTDEEITEVLNQMDSDEIHELYLKQQISAARNHLIVSIVIFAVGLIYNLYQVTTGRGTDAITILIPIGIFGAAYYRFKAIKSRRYSTSRIVRLNRRSKTY